MGDKKSCTNNTSLRLMKGFMITLLLIVSLIISACNEDSLLDNNSPRPDENIIADQSHIKRAADGTNIRIPGIDYENLSVKSPDTKIAAGLFYSLIIDQTGDLYYLGKNNFYDFDGKVLEFLAPSDISMFKIEGVSDARSVSIGLDYAIVLLNSGDLCFLYTNIDQQYELIPSTLSITVEKAINLENIKAVSKGFDHTLILLESGDLYAFGNNEKGQLGIGTKQNQNQLVLVEALTDVAAISAGNKYSLVVLYNGDIYAFGSNSYGQLGLGDQADRNKPVLIDTLSGAVAASAGANHSLVLLGNGDVYAFGNGFEGQLGQGDKKHYLLPAKIQGLSNIKAISTGEDFSLVLCENGKVYAFGFAPHLGLGERSFRGYINEPSEIKDTESVKTIAAGMKHSFLSSDSGDIYYFGNIIPTNIIYSPKKFNLFSEGKFLGLPDHGQESPDKKTLTGFWQGIVDYHDYNHAQVLLHFSENGIFTTAFPQSGYLCIFRYIYLDQGLYIFNPLANQWNGPVDMIVDEGELISLPDEQLKDIPDQELQGFGLFYPIDENTYHNLTKKLEIFDFSE